MRTFYYVHTGHRIGLDRFRRATTILRALNDENITLLSSDFRIAQIARDFGVRDCVGLDVVRNIPQIAHHGDKLIFDSDEANPIMLDDMRNFFSSFIRISDRMDDKKAEKEYLISPYLKGENICNTLVVDDKYFGDFNKTVEISFFFGDDDYEKDLEKNLNILEGLTVDLQLGFYYFLDYEELLKQKFSHYFEFEEYDEMIQSTKILITSSPQATLENLASGGTPIYLQREDYTTDFIEIFKHLHIPVVHNYHKEELHNIIKNIDTISYTSPEKMGDLLANFLKEILY